MTTGTFTRFMTRTLTAVTVLSASTVIQKFKQVTLTAMLIVNASTIRSVSRIIAATSTVTAAVTRTVNRGISASTVATGVTFRGITRVLTGVTVITGVVIISKVKQITLAAITVVNAFYHPFCFTDNHSFDSAYRFHDPFYRT